jgi:hypothetical protein
MKKACVLEIKIGTKDFSSYDKNKSANSIQKASTGILGFRINGCKYWNVKNSEYSSLIGSFFLNKKQIEEILTNFVDNGVEKRIQIYKNVIEILKDILNIFETQYMYQFCGRYFNL